MKKFYGILGAVALVMGIVFLSCMKSEQFTAILVAACAFTLGASIVASSKEP